MSHLGEALVGWLIWMGMVFGGVGVLLFVLSAIRSVALLIQHARRAGLEAELKASEEPQKTQI